MARRLKLHEELCEILESTNVYFQPPQSLSMKYPCVRYAFGEPNQTYANDLNYNYTRRYDGVVIDRDPESTLPIKIAGHFSRCKFGKPYIADNLNHFPFTLYY